MCGPIIENEHLWACTKFMCLHIPTYIPGEFFFVFWLEKCLYVESQYKIAMFFNERINADQFIVMIENRILGEKKENINIYNTQHFRQDLLL